jgi:hypothetical protein
MGSAASKMQSLQNLKEGEEEEPLSDTQKRANIYDCLGRELNV